ncbi:MAG: hypothetical protein R3237_02110 [Nitrosopumilaceae archaeon]|nr:hypothetical protein [Nitrosopumilaceae archaeon]
MRYIGFGLILLLGTVIFPISAVFAQTSIDTSPQTTLSGDLAKNPVAQDILEKIEQTKKWIADLEKREYEKTQAQKELEEKRSIALERLNQDLIEWENLWANFTSRAAFERFVEDKPTPVQGVFWDQFEFKEMKVEAGREALKETIANGGSLSEARAAYHKAAETKRIELIEMNAQFNVKHNLAYYKEQLLFNSTGHLTLDEYTKATLGDFYADYRTSPEYLDANPNDKYAYESLSTGPNTICRDGYVVVHRLTSNDYACISESTAERWERHGIGKVVDTNAVIYDEYSLTPTVPTNPATECKEKHVVVYHFEAKAYGCVLESVAQTWIDGDKAEIHDLTKFIKGKDKQKDITNKIFILNQEIQQHYEANLKEIAELKKKYDLIYQDADKAASKQQKELLSKFYSEVDMSKEELSLKILELRENNEKYKEKILSEKLESVEQLQKSLHTYLQEMASSFKDDPDIKVIWDSAGEKFYAAQR